MANQTVLVVDDDSTMVKLVTLTLESVGFQVHGARNFQAALTILAQKSGEIEVAVVDYELPGSHLDDLLRAVRSQPRPIRSIVTSGYPLDLLEERGVALPLGVEFLKKPFLPKDLIAAVRNAFMKVAASGC